MKFIFELSKEHKSLPKSEILSCLNAEEIQYNLIEANQDVLLIDIVSKNAKIKDISNRLSYTFNIDEFLFSCSPTIKDIKIQASKYNIKKNGSIAIRYRNRSNEVNSQEIVQALAKIYSKDRKVTLKKPDIEVRALITNLNVYVGLRVSDLDRQQFENRKVQHRPYFSPISLHPKLARALVNLSAIKKNEVLLDPFCGTGGILIEAGIIGISVVGSDIEDKMVKGCKENLDFYKIKDYKLFSSDIGSIHNHVSNVDAVVTDLPYGKSTTTKREDIKLLYERTFKSISRVLKMGGRAVIGLSDKNMLSLGEHYIPLLEKHDFRVHSSLTRYFGVYKK
jgi:tRNA (guanine10-N2)-dimethyltransferase